ncbi:MAG: PD40 domain-containing protein [Deltaproteobacteria bacterium]|nr:PD40 domain-containing protein [Deltaproteobacteria bacterium]
MDIQICQSCGAKLDTDALTCPECGAKTETAIKAEEAEAEHEALLSMAPPQTAKRIRELEEKYAEGPSVAVCVQLSGLYKDLKAMPRAIAYMQDAVALDPENKFLKQKLRILIDGPDAAAAEEYQTVTRQSAESRKLVRAVGIAAGVVLALVAAYFAYRVLFPSAWRVAAFSGEKMDALQPKYSPDGTKIAFVKAPKFTVFGIVDSLAGKQEESHLMVVDAESGDPRSIAKFVGTRPEFDWIPGTGDLSFVNVDETWKPTVYRVAADGGVPSSLVNAREFSWSPDGRKLAYVADLGWSDPAAMHENDALFLYNTETGNSFKISAMECSSPSFSPDGKKIAFQARDQRRQEALYNEARYNPDAYDDVSNYRGDIYVFDVVTEQTVAVTDEGLFDQPAFSPDGSKLFVLGYTDPNGYENSLFVMNPDGTDRRVLLTKGEDYEYFRDFAVSPDGKSVVFEGIFVNPDKPRSESMESPLGAIGGDTNYLADLFIVGVDGAGLRRLPSKKFRSRSAPDFSPDGSSIAFQVEYVEMRHEIWASKL